MKKKLIIASVASLMVSGGIFGAGAERKAEMAKAPIELTFQEYKEEFEKTIIPAWKKGFGAGNAPKVGLYDLNTLEVYNDSAPLLGLSLRGKYETIKNYEKNFVSGKKLGENLRGILQVGSKHGFIFFPRRTSWARGELVVIDTGNKPTFGMILFAFEESDTLYIQSTMSTILKTSLTNVYDLDFKGLQSIQYEKEGDELNMLLQQYSPQAPGGPKIAE